MKSAIFKLAPVLMLCLIYAGCGVKSPPTPALPAAPGPVQTELENRARLKKEKQSEKERAAGTEKSAK